VDNLASSSHPSPGTSTHGKDGRKNSVKWFDRLEAGPEISLDRQIASQNSKDETEDLDALFDDVMEAWNVSSGYMGTNKDLACIDQKVGLWPTNRLTRSPLHSFYAECYDSEIRRDDVERPRRVYHKTSLDNAIVGSSDNSGSSDSTVREGLQNCWKDPLIRPSCTADFIPQEPTGTRESK